MPELAPPTVLTVDDNPIIRADLRLTLESAGFSVCAEGRDGIEAVELADAHRPDVILLDLVLPGLDGVEATRRIRRDREVPIVALTGHGGGLVERAVEAGASSYILKPFSEAELVHALRRALAASEEEALHAAREESCRSLVRMLSLLGQPVEWAAELERRSFEAGKVWREKR